MDELLKMGQFLAVCCTWVMSCGGRALAADAAGTYLLHGTAHAKVSPFPARDYPGDMKAVLTQDDPPDQLILRLESHSYACTFRVVLLNRGVVSFPETTACPIEVAQADARG